MSQFESAVDAIVTGDIATLQRMLREEPGLIHDRSTSEHHATLLHYVAANGVEDHRQQTPANVVEIAQLLLEAGAKIDAIANIYGSSTTLALAATSIHPERAGVQEALLETLLKHGAKLARPGSGPSLITACLANGRLKAAEFLARRVDHLDLAEAAGLGRLDLVQGFFAEDGSLKSSSSEEQRNQGFLYACQFGRDRVIEFLIEKGGNIAASDANGQTGLHWAVIGGHIETVRLLLEHKPPLEATNNYGGSVLGQALWSAAHGGDPETYVSILETLSTAGAKIPERQAPINDLVDVWLRQHGSLAEPTWQ